MITPFLGSFGAGFGSKQSEATKCVAPTSYIAAHPSCFDKLSMALRMAEWWLRMVDYHMISV